MPLYEYECPKCQAVTEAIRPMRDADEPLPCEKCGNTRTARKHSVFMTAAPKPTSSPTPRPGGCGGGCSCHPH